MRKFSHDKCHMYLTGSIPALGEWIPERACRMNPVGKGADGSWNGKWRLDVEIDDDLDEIEYRYIIVIEGDQGNNRRAILTDPTHVLRLSSCSVVRSSEGEPIQIKDSFRINKNGSALLSSSTLDFRNTHTSSVIDTATGHV